MNLSHMRPVCGPQEAPSVFVLDADTPARNMLALMIRSVGWRPVMASSAEEFLAQPRSLTPGCLLMELNLPGRNGLQLQQLVLDRPEMPIIFMSNYADVRAAVCAMKAGAFEFLVKPLVGDVVLQAIGQGIDRSRETLRRLTQTHALQERYESLSRREREVMSLVVCGRLNKQVGGDLGISEITVKAHRGKIMRKMRANSFAELVNMAGSLGCGAPTNASDFGVPGEFRYGGQPFVQSTSPLFQ